MFYGEMSVLMIFIKEIRVDNDAVRYSVVFIYEDTYFMER